MKEYKFLLKQFPKHPKNYGIIDTNNYQRLSWQKMAEELPQNEKYLNYFIEEEWIDTSDKDGFFIPFVDNQSLKIPYGTLTKWLYVYTEPQIQNIDIDWTHG